MVDSPVAVNIDSSIPGSERLRPWLTTGRSVAIVATVALVVRALGVFSNPLIVTWDGMEYIKGARSLHLLTPYRTPGYSLLLSATFWVFGENPVGVLGMQHALGVAMCVVTAWASARLAGPAWGVGVGLAMALEPSLLAFESHALSESSGTALAVLCTGLALADRRPRPATGVALGLLLGMACLVRPALQVFVPFYALGWALRAGTRIRRALLLLAFVGVGVAVTTGPWLAFNARRGVNGLARGEAIAAWFGLGRLGLLIEPPDYVDAKTAQAFHKYLKAGEPNSEGAVWQFYNEIRAVRDKAPYDLLERWRRDSVRRHPARFAAGVLRAIPWQVNVFWGPYLSDYSWTMSRFREDARTVGQAAPNFNAGGDISRYEAFVMHQTTGGLLHRFLGWYSVHYIQGWPQVPLLLAAIAGVVVGLWRRRWTLALVCVGSLAFLAAHAFLLQSVVRYGNPAWATWYIVVAGVAGALQNSSSRVETEAEPQ